MKIEKIHLHNFKGIDEMEFSMSDTSAIILGGKNGFGKTTIFDALELLLTGSIARYSAYADELIDHRRSYSQYELPLVCSSSVPDVRLEAMLKYDLDGEYRFVTIVRKALIRDMKNPVDFSVFTQLYIKNEDGEDLPATEHDLETLGLKSLMDTYISLHYLSQEESTQFVKSSDISRVDSIQYLFNTKRFDERIDKIDKLILKGTKRYDDEIKSEQSNIKARIEELERYQVGAIDGEVESFSIFKETAHIEWDSNSPRLNNEEFYGLLTENGTLDKILYMVSHKEDVRKYRKETFLKDILDKRHDYSFYWYYRSKTEQIKLWDEFKKKVVDPFERLTLNAIPQYTLYVIPQLQHIVTQDVYEGIQEKIGQIKRLYQAATAAERAYNEMLEYRNRLSAHLLTHADRLGENSCPLCGQPYEDIQHLKDTINNTTALQLSSSREFSAHVAREFDGLKGEINKEYIAPILDWFTDNGVTEGVVRDYTALNEPKMKKVLDLLIERKYIGADSLESVEANGQSLLAAINEKREPCDETLDYHYLMDAWNNYGRYLKEDCFTEEAVMKKRAFLTLQWAMQKSNQMKRLMQEKRLADKKVELCARMVSDLRALRTEIVKQKNEWLRKVISDVEILFYIYSGRIMQDNFFGRGLFMKVEFGKYIYFVSYLHSDVDALYKMSSGQLVALMVSLMLSLNKLYATEKFIAIDDPVQTIDDINVWGFVETLRHEFKDYQLMFSTHELSYGSFLRYKLSRMGINTEYRDMLKERNREN